MRWAGRAEVEVPSLGQSRAKVQAVLQLELCQCQEMSVLISGCEQKKGGKIKLNPYFQRQFAGRTRCSFRQKASQDF